MCLIGGAILQKALDWTRCPKPNAGRQASGHCTLPQEEPSLARVVSA